MVFAQTAPTPPSAPPAAGTPAPAAPTAAPQPPTPVPFVEALPKSVANLLGQIKKPADPAQKVVVTIDPLIDGITGSQSVVTRDMGKKIVEIAAKDFPHIQFIPFNSKAVEQKPIVLVGTFTPINNATNKGEGVRDAYRMCFALADLKENKVVGKAAIRAKPDGIENTPLPYFQDSPVWSKDAATDAYIRTCQASKLNEPIDPQYTERIQAAALASDAIEAYNARRYGDALALYQSALKAPGGDQLRVHNGIYLASWKLNKRQEAADAFGKVVDYSLANNRLAVRFLFRPGTTQFVPDKALTAPYPMWLQQISSRAAAKNACLELVGHSSPTGPEPVNVRLSHLRADYVRDRLQDQSKTLVKRLISTGVGSKETLIGTGKDNASDALDRRVEFKVINCA
jgi:outer membrane protein OmpA-like peptidoglycan-associated protein